MMNFAQTFKERSQLRLERDAFDLGKGRERKSLEPHEKALGDGRTKAAEFVWQGSV